MRFKVKILWTTLLTTQLWPLIVLGIEVHEAQSENTTENDDLLPLPTTEAITVSPPDNGMVLGEAPNDEATPSEDDTTSTDPLVIKFPDVDEVPKPTVSSSILLDYPENHKNFTGSPYLGAIETPPILDTYNKYRQQYKEYYEQKNQYHQQNQKPIKFEENSAKNRYVSQGLSAYLDPDAKKQLENLRYRHKPFPYVYEHEQNRLLNNYEQGSGNAESLSTHHYHVAEGHQNTEHGIQNSEDEEEHTTHTTHATHAAHKLPLTSHKILHEPHYVQGHEHHVQKEDQKSGSTWKKVLRMLTTLVPLGLFIATLTPNVLSINSTTDQRPSRQRSLDGLGIEITEEDLKDPLVKLVQAYGLESLDDPQCEDKIFCEMSRMGENESSNFIQRGFWYLAHETPEDLAQKVGMKELFKAIRTGACDMYKCEPKKKIEQEVKPEKKLKSEIKVIRKKKIIKESRKL